MNRLGRYARDLKDALEARLVPIEGGPLDGQLVMSAGVMQEAIAAVPEPPPDEHTAELQTPATIYVWLRCHLCGEQSASQVRIESKTMVDDKRRTIAPKVDASTVDHICGQINMYSVGPEVEGQEEFDWTIPVEGVTEDKLADMLRRVGLDPGAEMIDGWTEPQRDLAAQWALAVWVAREHGDDEPEAPEHVKAVPRPAPEVPEVCPFPGCARDPEHRGGHRDAEGKLIKKPKVAPVDPEPETDTTEDDGLLPE